MKKKSIALLMACMLTLGVAVGGTMAWLTDTTSNVTNTFTVGDIEIDIEESGTDTNGNQNYNFVPGDTKAKDPKVIVDANSEDCYLFIKIVEEHNTCTVGNNTANPIVSWTVRGQETNPVNQDATANWVKFDPNSTGNTTAGTYFYYRKVTKNTSNQEFYVFTGEGDDEYKNGKVVLNEDITKEMVNIINNSNTKPTITISAAAVQQAHIDTVTDAWNELPVSFTGVTGETTPESGIQ